MRKTKRFGSKKVTLSTILTVLALCGSLSVSAADTLDLSTGDTHKNTVTNNLNSENDTVALGFDNRVDSGALVIGDLNYAISSNSTAVGRKNTARGGSVSFGYNNYAQVGSTVIGINNFGTESATVVGTGARGAKAVAIGTQASSGIFNIDLTSRNDPTTSEYSTAIGNYATALVGTSLGTSAKSDHGGVAVGNGANAMYGGTALGKGSATAENTYSYVRADGVALGDNSYANRGYGIYGYVPLKDTPDIVKSVYATTAATDSMANDIALANKTGDDSVVTAVTNFYNTYGEDVYNDYKTVESAYEKAVMAYDKQAAKMNSTTYATEADRAADLATLNDLAAGKKTAIAALNAFEKEHDGIAKAVLRKDSALSTYKATAAAVSLGYGTTDSNEAVTRQITNLAAGTADTDAVNVAQLKQVKTYADGIANTVKELTDKVASGSRDFAGDDKSKVSVKVGETMEITGGAATDNLSDDNIGVVAKGENGVSVKLSKDLKGLNTAEFNTSITVGTGDNKTVITGDSIRTGNTTINNNGLTINNSDPTKNITIQDGNINMGGNAIHNVGEATEAGDAINKGQFDRTINNIGNGMNEMNGRINQIGRDVNRVGAGAAALASLHPLDFDPDDKGSFAVGFGSYKSEHAAALGAFYRPNEDTMVNLAATIGNNDNMYSAGVSFKIGSSSPYHNMSKSEMAVKLETQDKQLSDQNQKIETLESQNQDLNARLAKLEALVASK
ncbi:YadA-like family protein [uncultured Megasphaera sp.]|uniref:YadA-like family protein n=1 Tax=uncultured Megasphaera sp. TaxID=165188 RepID=UPI0025E88E7E|nr:YadA-like family protein [uncultured Megasphaera sp.]